MSWMETAIGFGVGGGAGGVVVGLVTAWMARRKTIAEGRQVEIKGSIDLLGGARMAVEFGEETISRLIRRMEELERKSERQTLRLNWLADRVRRLESALREHDPNHPLLGEPWPEDPSGGAVSAEPGGGGDGGRGRGGGGNGQ